MQIAIIVSMECFIMSLSSQLKSSSQKRCSRKRFVQCQKPATEIRCRLPTCDSFSGLFQQHHFFDITKVTSYRTDVISVRICSYCCADPIEIYTGRQICGIKLDLLVPFAQLDLIEQS